MFAVQLALSLALWATVIAVLVKRREWLLRRMAPIPRGRRALVAMAMICGSLALLVLGMGCLALGGLTPKGLTWWGWPVITLTGAGFIVLQSVGLVPLMLNAVTADRSRPSDKEDSRHP